jgi:hypothetical protein
MDAVGSVIIDKMGRISGSATGGVVMKLVSGSKGLSSVAPAKRAAVEKRIAVLRRYCAIEEPTMADAEQAAAELGISMASLYRLAKVWRETKDPSKLASPGGSQPTGLRPHPGDDLARSVLAGLPAGRPMARDVSAIQKAAREQGVSVRSALGLQKLVRQVRAETLGVAGAAYDAFVDQVALELPVLGSSGPAMPIASILANRDGIVCVRLDLASPGPALVAKLLVRAAGLGAISSDGKRPMTLAFDTDTRPSWPPLIEALASNEISHSGDEWNVLRGGRLGSSMVYPQMLGIKTHTKQLSRPPHARPLPVKKSVRQPLTLEQAQTAVDELVAAQTPGPIRIPKPIDELVQVLGALPPD